MIVTAAMEAAPQNLTGSIVAVIYGANMGVSFLAPLMAGLIADAYGLPTALLSISVFPLLAAVVMMLLFRPANCQEMIFVLESCLGDGFARLA